VIYSLLHQFWLVPTILRFVLKLYVIPTSSIFQLVNTLSPCGRIKLRIFGQENKYIHYFTGSGSFSVVLGSFKSSRIYLLGSSLSFLVGITAVE